MYDIRVWIRFEPSLFLKNSHGHCVNLTFAIPILFFVLFFTDSEKSFTNSTSGYHAGNLIVPIGSNKIHCDPPKEYEQPKGKFWQTSEYGRLFLIFNVNVLSGVSFCRTYCAGWYITGRTTIRVWCQSDLHEGFCYHAIIIFYYYFLYFFINTVIINSNHYHYYCVMYSFVFFFLFQNLTNKGLFF